MTVTLHTVGPSLALLAEQLALRGWAVESMGQYTTQRGWIVGRHDTPDDYVGFGISDGTRIMRVVYETEQPDLFVPETS